MSGSRSPIDLTSEVFPVTSWRPLEPTFDRVVQILCADILPDGFDVAEQAPSSLADLKLHVAQSGRILIWSGASEYTIYGSPSVNHIFRAWHDWHHLSGDHPFTLAGEAAVACAQISQMELKFPGNPNLSRWRALVIAEVLGQAIFSYLNDGAFPHNQRAFVKAFLELFAATVTFEEVNAHRRPVNSSQA